MLDALGAVSEEPWEDAGMAGVRLLHLDGGPKVATADCGLVHVEPGRAFPPHRHLGDEWVLVLQGQAQEDSGRQFLPGDLIHKAPGTVHSFRILGKEPFAFAVVLFEGLAWAKV
jgi:putative transcriptional regulator